VLLALDYFIEKGFKSVMGAPTRHKADEGFFIYIIDPGSGILFEYYACARLVFAPDHLDVHYLKTILMTHGVLPIHSLRWAKAKS
jgi:catechol 2,3-dioxygenase